MYAKKIAVIKANAKLLKCWVLKGRIIDDADAAGSYFGSVREPETS